MTDLSIIIVSWNTKDLLRECLHSIYTHTHNINFEVFVVDNASTDGSPQMVKKDFPQVKLIENDANLGFAKACNQCIKLAEGRYILLLNSDTVVLPNAQAKMVEFMDKHPEAGACGPRLLNSDGSVQRSAFGIFPSPLAALIERFYLHKLFPNAELVKKFEMTHQANKTPYKVGHLLGACLMIKGDFLKQIGMLDESFTLFLEETDLCYKLKELNKAIYYLPDVQVAHHGQQSVVQNIPESEIHYFQSYCKFYSKHNDSRAKLALLKLVLLSALPVRAGNYFLIKRQPSKAKEVMAAFVSIARGLIKKSCSII